MILAAFDGSITGKNNVATIAPSLPPGQTKQPGIKSGTIAAGVPMTRVRRLTNGRVLLTFVSRFQESGRNSLIGWNYYVERCSVDAADGNYANCAKKNLWQTAERTDRYALPRLSYLYKPAACAWYHVRSSNPAGFSPFAPFRTDNDLTKTTPQRICPPEKT